MLTLKVRMAAHGFNIPNGTRDAVLDHAERAVEEFSSDPNHSVEKLGVAMALIQEPASRALFKVCVDSILKHKHKAPWRARAVVVTQMGMYADEILRLADEDENKAPSQQVKPILWHEQESAEIPRTPQISDGLRPAPLPEPDPNIPPRKRFPELEQINSLSLEILLLREKRDEALHSLEFEQFAEIADQMEEIRSNQISLLTEQIEKILLK